ncbi:MAG: glutathione S-transferase family protein [Hormoscilla sp. SP5CHS1]|nr:glutathione S-transferase family protein [Hormoscilla sp. SP12CHS1]MBC6455435.1 glutathione S-transferase family protein [Hormoscilla sp. SP5CHS1]
MLKLYHHPISGNSRRVWIALLEKQIPFELVSLSLDGDQLQPEFLALNPFHHIPVLEDEDFSVVESLAILDYLEAKYPTPALLPTDTKTLATVRMVEMVTVNELQPAMNPLVRQMMGFAEEDAEKMERSRKQIATVLSFLESKLNNSLYFAGEQLTLAEVVAGTLVCWLPNMGVSLEEYPKLKNWLSGLMQRPSWQETQPTPEYIEAFKPQARKLMEKQSQG